LIHRFTPALNWNYKQDMRSSGAAASSIWLRPCCVYQQRKVKKKGTFVMLVQLRTFQSLSLMLRRCT